MTNKLQPGSIQSKWLQSLKDHPERQIIPIKNIEVLFSRIDNKDKNDCMNWKRGKNKNGYGYIQINRISYRAHRLIYKLLKGDILNNQLVCHKCDNPGCCNPEHLFLGTKSENNADRAQKGRNRDQTGEKNNKAILTEEKVLNILNSIKTTREIAEEFGVAKITINQIKRGVRWKHIFDAYFTKSV